MEKPKRRTLTSPGLGSGEHPKHTQSSKISTRRARTSRPPLRVDDVGDVAVFIAGRHARMPPAAAPKLLKTRAELAAAPIDHRDGFVLSLLDGKTSVQGVVDIAAMPDGEVVAILERLAKLGIVGMP